MRKTMQILFGSLIIMFCLSINVFAATTEYDVSPTGDGSTMAIFEGETLTIRKISGTGATKDYTTYFDSNIGDVAQTPWNSTNLPLQVKKIVVEEGITKLGNSLFAYTQNLGAARHFQNVEEVVLPSTLTQIGNRCFIGDSALTFKLTSITIPKNVESLGKNVFANRKDLKNVYFAQGSKLSNTGTYTFSGCTGLEEIILPDSMRTVGNYAFQGAGKSGNCKIVLNEGLVEIGSSAFYSSNFESLVIPSTVTTIGSEAFRSMTRLKVLTNLSKNSQVVATSSNKAWLTLNVYLYSTNTGLIEKLPDIGTNLTVEFLDEPILSGTLENGTKWTYDPATKILTFEGEGEIPSYTTGSQPWFGASYAYGIGGINLGYISGIGGGAFSGLSFGSSSPLFWGQHESLGGVLSGQTGLPISYQGAAPAGTGEVEEDKDKTGIWNFVDGQEVIFPDVKPRIQNGEILSPLRFIFQDLGATVIWNPENSYAIIRKEENGRKVEIVLKPNSSSMWVNGAEYTSAEIGLDATVILENGRLLLPGRAIIKAWETVQFKASRPSATVYEDYYFKTSEAVEGGDDKLKDIPTIDEWQEEGTVITPENEEEILKNNTSTGYMANIIINSEATSFDIVLPIVFDISMLSTGEIIVGSDYQLINNCAMGPIEIVNIQVNPIYGYSISSFTYDYKNSKAGIQIFGMTINSQEVSTNGNVPLNDSLKAVIRNKEAKELVIDVRLPAQNKSFREGVAAVVFTVDFDKVK